LRPAIEGRTKKNGNQSDYDFPLKITWYMKKEELLAKELFNVYAIGK